MKRSIRRLVECTVRAKDGDLGRVEGFYFDDHKWIIRYMVVDTRRWLPGRQVLISTAALKRPEWRSRALPVNLTKQQVRSSPNIDADKPVSRQHEAALHDYYNWPVYWGPGLEPAAGGGYPLPTRLPQSAKAKSRPHAKPADRHLRSTSEVIGYHIQALDGAIGHVEDFIVDDETWAIRYVVVNTQNWLPGKKVLVSPAWITRVSWDRSKVFVDLSRESVKNSPVFDPSKPVSRGHEERLFDHYERSKYWEEKPDTDPAHYLCQRCGRKFLAQLELREHRKQCRVGKQPRRSTTEVPGLQASIITKIEDQRPETWGGYRETDRSS